jgi:hypothetical protein
MYQHNPELRGSEILGNESFKLQVTNYDSLSLSAFVAIICSEDTRLATLKGKDYHNLCVLSLTIFIKNSSENQ